MGFLFTDTNTRDRDQINRLMQMLCDERERCARAEGQLDLAHEQLAIAQNNFEWARVRLNQVEAERATFLSALLHLPIAPPAIEREEPPQPATATPGVGLPISLGFDFEDVGDDAARRMGLEHDDGGALRYRN